MKFSRLVATGLLALSLLWPGLISAQQESAKIEGRVSDSQQLALAQAVVELKDSQQNAVQKTVADGTGHYEFNGLAAGTYNLTMSRSGFADGQAGPITVAAGEGAVLVDLYTALSVDVTRFIGVDGLHPTEAGYARMAEVFFEAIRVTLEVR